MHKPESVLENGKHKITLDFEIQADHFITVKRPDVMIVNQKKKKKGKKKTCRIVICAVLEDYKLKIIENEMSDKYLDSVRKLIKLWNIKIMVIPSAVEYIS